MLEVNYMKHSFIVFTILFCITFANAQNPFEAYGYTPKIATLSNGKYNEFHDLDTIVQIGTVLFNTQTKQIIAFLQVDTLYSEATLQPDIVSMWMSPDPLSDERPSLSPYNFCQNNPIIFVDPDGRLDDYYLNLKSGQVEYHEGSENRIDQGLVNIAGDNATVGDIQDALTQRNYNYQKDASVPGGFRVDTEKQYKGWKLLQGSKTLAFAFGAEATFGLLGLAAEGYSMYRAAAIAKTFNATKGAVSAWPAASGGRVVINGIEYSIHALERMQPVGTIMKGTTSFSRGIPPSVVENVIKYGTVTPGNTALEVVRTFQNVRVITNPAGTRVISVIKIGL
jgi:hypothetical protein